MSTIQFRIIYIILALIAGGSSAPARLTEAISYKELFEKADLVAIAVPVSTVETTEHTSIGGFPVTGITTQFQVQLVLKGDKEVSLFMLHHYTLANPNEPVVNGPDLVSFNTTKAQVYLVFLVREHDGA
jgi:hypothetical protein